MSELEASILLRVGAVRDSSLDRSLRGTVDSARKASNQIGATNKKRAKESKEAALDEVDAAKRALHDKARTADQLARKELRDEERAHAAKRRAIAATAKAARRAAEIERREAEKTARKQIQEAERVSTRRRAIARGVGGAVVGGVLGAGAGAVTLARRAQSLAGVSDPLEQLRVAGLVDDKLIRAGNQAGISDDRRGQIKESLIDASTAFQIPQEELAGAVQVAQERYSRAFGILTSMLPEIAGAAQATESDAAELTAALGAIGQAADLKTLGDYKAALLEIVESSNQGAIAVGDFAGAMAPVAGLAKTTSGADGIGFVQEFSALAQQMGASGARTDEVGTMMKQYMERLASPEVRARLMKEGVQTTVDGKTSGQLLPQADIIANLEAQKEQLLKPGVLDKITGAAEVSRAFKFAMLPGAQNFRDIESASGGQEFIDKTVRDLTTSSQGKLRQVAVDTQATATRTGAKTMDAATPWAKAISEFQAANPLLSELAGPGMTTLGGLGGGALLMKLMGGGAAASAAGAGAAGAGAAGAGGAAAGAAGIGLAGLAGGAAAVTATGLGSYYGASKVLESSGYEGDWLSKTAFDLFGPRAEDMTASYQPPKEVEQNADAMAKATADALDKHLAGAALDGKLQVEVTINQEGRARVSGVSTRGPVRPSITLGAQR